MENSISPPERIGFVGLGNMGAPMARRLMNAGYPLTVADASADAVQRFLSNEGAEPARSLRELGSSCRVVITMLPDGNAVREVLLSDNGVASGLRPGSIAIDMSSAAPISTREIHDELARRGVSLIDAPVSGGVKKAGEGTLAVMAGGDADIVARCRSLLENFGKIFLTGGSGSGHALKSLNNYLSAAALAITAEAVMAGERFGLDPGTMLEVLNASTGRNTATDHKYPTFVLPRTFNSGFALGLMAKDLRLALDLVRSMGTPCRLLEDCTALWSRAESQLGGRADNTEIVKYLESLTERSGDSARTV
jgi:3-hydroxyisobutyrate dehydrogenase